MASCPKCGTSLLPNTTRCARCGTSVGSGPGSPNRAVVLVAAIAGLLVTAGAGAAALVLVSRDRGPDEVEIPVAGPPAGEPQPSEPADDVAPDQVQVVSAEDRMEEALVQARKQIAETRKRMPDEASRRTLDEALATMEEQVVVAKKKLAAEKKPEAEAAPPQQGESCDRDQVFRVVKAHSREIKLCYEQRLRAKPGLSGKLVVRMVIAPTGAMQSAETTEDTLGDADTTRCVEAAVRKWKFPATGGPCTVSFPFKFAAAD